MAHAAAFGHSRPEDPDWAKTASEAYSLINSYGRSDVEVEVGLKSIPCPAEIRNCFGVPSSAPTHDEESLLMFVLAAAGFVGSPAGAADPPRPLALDMILCFAGQALPNSLPPTTPKKLGSILGLIGGISLRIVRLCLPAPRGEDGECLHSVASDWLFGGRGLLGIVLDSLAECTSEHLEVFAEDLAAYVLAAAALFEDSGVDMSNEQVARNYLCMVRLLLHSQVRILLPV